jgi:hypothetical protein
MAMSTTIRPDRSEAADYYFRYIDQVTDDDVCRALETQGVQALTLLRGISEDRSRYRYAPDKWSIREVLGHVNDTERLFVFRALWFARGLESPLPSFEQDVAVGSARSNDVSWHRHVEEFQAVRASTVAFFHSLPDDAWTRRGKASGYDFSVRACAFIAAGHVTHHLKILRERYL